MFREPCLYLMSKIHAAAYHGGGGGNWIQWKTKAYYVGYSNNLISICVKLLSRRKVVKWF